MKQILVIDDDMFIRDLVGTKLSEGYTVETKANGTEGLESMKHYVPDLVVLDLELPDIHGLEILKKIKGDPKTENIPVIIFSNNEADEWEPKVREAGADDFFVKVSIDMNELKAHIDKMLE